MATHKHIWKYTTGSDERVCEAPIPTMDSCGLVEKIKPNQPADWENQLKIMVSDWIMRLAKFGDITIPKRQGFTVFEHPYLEQFIKDQKDQSFKSGYEEALKIHPEALARMFHRIYENLAPEFSYETRKASAKPWSEVPENNRKLMIATCAQILNELTPISKEGK